MASNYPFSTPEVRRKIFVSYHHQGDQPFYDQFSTAFHQRLELITDNSLERKVDSSNHDYIMRRIREHHLRGSSCTIVLCGQNTWRRKYVDWEIEASLCQQMGLVGVRLPTLLLQPNGGTDKPARLQDNIDSGYATWVQWSDIVGNWGNLTSAIERANAQSKRFISNARPRMARNL